MSAVEWWVMRVLRSAERLAVEPVTPGDLVKIERGELAVVNGELCEPIDEYASQEKAIAKAAALSSWYGWSCKVVMSADVS